MTKLKKLALSNREFIQRMMSELEAKTGYPVWSVENIVRLCDDSENKVGVVKGIDCVHVCNF